MRIAQFIETLEAGGAERLAVDFANSLASRGHETHLIVLRGDGPFRSRISTAVNLEVLERNQVFGSTIKRLSHFRATYKQLSGVVSSLGLDVVQTHLPRANFLGLFLGRSGRVRVFPTIHNNREFDYGEDTPWLMEFARRRAYRQMLAWCDGMIAVSDQVKSGMAQELGIAGSPAERDIVVVPNGVSVPDVLAPEHRDRIRAQYGVDEGDVLIVAVGRLSRQKNFKSLVQALSAVSERLDTCRCVIAGEGEEREDIQKCVDELGLTEKVVLAGHVSAIGELLAAGDIFCLPSRYEGLPLALLEAMAAGLPVCSYEIAGVADVVVNGREALLSAPENYQGLADSIVTLATNEEKRRSMGIAAKSLVVNEYSFEKSVDRLVEIYRGEH